MPRDVLSSNINNPAAYGPRMLEDENPPEFVIDPASPQPIADPPGFSIGGTSVGIQDNSVNSLNSNINNNTNTFGVYDTKRECGMDLDLSAAFGGGAADTLGGQLGAMNPGNAIFIPDAEDTSSGNADTNARIWIRFDNKQVWWPVRGGFELTGWPYTSIYAKWDAQGTKKMYLRGWMDKPLDRVDGAA